MIFKWDSNNSDDDDDASSTHCCNTQSYFSDSVSHSDTDDNDDDIIIIKFDEEALKFVTCWLEQEQPRETSSRILSFSHLCSQKIAAEISSSFLESIDNAIKDVNKMGWETNMNILHEEIITGMNENSIPQHLHDCVTEE